MSVTFYDPDHKAIYDEDYNHTGGVPEVNFANSNAYFILRLMGIAEAEASQLCGEMDGEAFRKRVFIGLANLSFWLDQQLLDQRDLKRRLYLLLDCFGNSKRICWD